jgi:hypothetical protein
MIYLVPKGSCLGGVKREYLGRFFGYFLLAQMVDQCNISFKKAYFSLRKGGAITFGIESRAVLYEWVRNR